MTLNSENTGSRRYSDSAARPNNLNIMSCSVRRQQPSVRICALRTSLWASPIRWPWARLDNTALDNAARILSKCLLASFSRHYQRQAGNKKTNKNHDENFLWFEFLCILLLFFIFTLLQKKKKKPKDKLVVRRNIILRWVVWPQPKNPWPQSELHTETELV